MRGTTRLFVVPVGIICVLLLLLSVYELRWLQNEHLEYHHDDSTMKTKISPIQSQSYSKSFSNPLQRTYAVFGRDVDSGFLKHVFNVFHNFGYKRQELNASEDWDVLWSHDYPFRKLNTAMRNLKHHQKVNHFPGTGYITNKMDLATSNIKFVPRAFKMPQQKADLLAYAAKHPKKMFVQKSNDHRGIKIKQIQDLDLKQNGTFIQEFIDDPLLVDGHKFDIGVYTIITSIDPLTVYYYNGDVLFRYCPEKYYPFDPAKVDKYVVGDDYLPTWEVPSLKKFYNEHEFSMKDSFDAYLKQSGRDPSKLWNQVEEAIREVCLSKEHAIHKILVNYPSKRNFFEMMRFDFAVDNDLNVYVMEANMSPNLSSAHFPPNRLLYEQVLFNLFHLVGLASMLSKESTSSMEVLAKNVMVYEKECFSPKCDGCMSPECQLCRSCLTPNQLGVLQRAYIEHNNRKDCKRAFPPSMKIPRKHISSYAPIASLSHVKTEGDFKQPEGASSTALLYIRRQAICSHRKHEIIEFPAILVDSEKQAVIDEFHSYVKPVKHPKLSDFCIELTGIAQETVDKSEEFSGVFTKFNKWLKKHGLDSKSKYAIVTDGPCDMGRFLFGQCEFSNVQFPYYAKKWINIRRVFSSHYKSRKVCLASMLQSFGVEFDGRLHCGLDDARNIANLLIHMIKDGVSIDINENIQENRMTYRRGNNNQRRPNSFRINNPRKKQQNQRQNKEVEPEIVDEEDLDFAMGLMSVRLESDAR
ncbi:probable tubulin polyglutamylase ttll-15 [Nilaparvata lugens]|uniref:probable tubulin polyglutamylase ttll-15 n=1 Tax=Nilaparvata lugens TaxID=108931 RepID=UPI00193E91BD|nr:probable tubulin polyglutamylase ttll-15 [Nilaparvata lugens]